MDRATVTRPTSLTRRLEGSETTKLEPRASGQSLASAAVDAITGYVMNLLGASRGLRPQLRRCCTAPSRSGTAASGVDSRERDDFSVFASREQPLIQCFRIRQKRKERKGAPHERLVLQRLGAAPADPRATPVPPSLSSSALSSSASAVSPVVPPAPPPSSREPANGLTLLASPSTHHFSLFPSSWNPNKPALFARASSRSFPFPLLVVGGRWRPGPR